ncbi:MAG TPA: DUF4198 domain-containing protein [Cyclobacteriaceae bacterium]|nr:DUF4198 domain-containing protein [Cyclobacteriaceae bacterium]
MKKLLSLLIVVCVSSLALAHEFWLLPKKFRYAVGEDVKIDFMVGENFSGEPWDLTKHKVETMQVISSYGKKVLTADVKPTRGNNLTYKLANDGTHLFTMTSNAAYIELDGAKFNDYLKEDGIEDILALRTKNNELDKPSRENYSRFTKLLVQSGANVEGDVFKRKIGHRVEIIPLTNPYKLKSGDYLECEILYEGKPLPHQMVKIWSFIGHRSFLQDAYTESDGKVKFPISNNGPWMVSFVKMIKSTRPNIDYESMWASLVFGVE